jgi:hypothetical protein
MTIIPALMSQSLADEHRRALLTAAERRRFQTSDRPARRATSRTWSLRPVRRARRAQPVGCPE